MSQNKQQSPNLRMPVDSYKKTNFADNELKSNYYLDIKNIVKCKILSKRKTCITLIQSFCNSF